MNEHAPYPQPPADNAAQAFEAMRRQLAMLTAAVEGFASRQDLVASRDYTPDIAQLLAAQKAAHTALSELASRPGVTLTPETMAAEINKAAVGARRADHEAFTKAMREQVDATRQLDGLIARKKDDQEQIDAMIWSWLFGAGLVEAVIIIPQLIHLFRS